MPNVHTPERQPDETMNQYKIRRAQSKIINQRLRLSTPAAREFMLAQKSQLMRDYGTSRVLINPPKTRD